MLPNFLIIGAPSLFQTGAAQHDDQSGDEAAIQLGSVN